MLYIILLLFIEALTLLALKDILQNRSRRIICLSVIIHVILSISLWWFLFENVTYKSFFDNPDHIALLMNLTGTICAVVVPRVILILFHFTGKLFRIKRGQMHVRNLNNPQSIQIIVQIFDFYFDLLSPEIKSAIKSTESNN